MKITLQKIADLSGFSITTVSRALAGYSDVNETTRQKIRQLADELGYVPSQIGRNLQSQKSNIIGIIFPLDEDFSNSFFMELIAGLTQSLAKHHYDLLISVKQPGSQEIEDYQRLVVSSRVDGIIIARTLIDDPRIKYLQEQGFPFVVSGHDESANYPFIDVDGFEGFYKLAQHFIELGHRDIAIINGSDRFAFAHRRFAGYKQALSDHGLSLREDYIAEGNLTKGDGVECTRRLLELPQRPTAIIACNDMMALGAMQVARQRGLVIGRDISIGGFDDIPLAAVADPPLTTIRQPIQEIGRQLVDMLIALIDRKTVDTTQQLIEPELVVRESSGPPINHADHKRR